ncbi:hypothetical protein ABPK482_gp27 [Acinetobacter phage vB_AbaP_APK14]|uniref:Uncharacterized protein n=1 Tax=Acinetobacter phage vB_AbaP_APK14 TaxID=2483772 RepID=A0A4P1LUC8_9CAUD|nr:hypothetical protein ABPK482_gp27 [Acinetobacter phage vB_AbaP_APK14]
MLLNEDIEYALKTFYLNSLSGDRLKHCLTLARQTGSVRISLPQRSKYRRYESVPVVRTVDCITITIDDLYEILGVSV